MAQRAIVALTIAGSDSGGGAGIQADLKTFAALGVYGASVVTALTAQNTRGVQGVLDIAPEFVARQMDSVLRDLDVGAVKIGMLSNRDVIAAVADGLRRHAVARVVLDPVMVATSGDSLISQDAVARLRDDLLPLADVLTPNLPEAAALLGEPIAQDEAEMSAQAQRLLALGPRAILLKGGHADGPESVDLLVDRDGVRRLAAARVATQNTHGTGCTLSSALAALMARGLPLHEAAEGAKAYLTAALRAADEVGLGHGHGPVHHFHAWWRRESGE